MGAAEKNAELDRWLRTERLKLALLASGACLFLVGILALPYFWTGLSRPSRQWLIQFEGGSESCPKPEDIDILLDLDRRTVMAISTGGPRPSGGTGAVAANRKLRLDLVQDNAGQVALTGTLGNIFGHGAWRRGPGCAGTWLAIDTQPVNRH